MTQERAAQRSPYPGLGSTAKAQLAFQKFPDNMVLACADLMAGRNSSPITNISRESDLESVIKVLNDTLTIATKSNPKLAEQFQSQYTALQGDITKVQNDKTALEKQFSDFNREQDAEYKKLMQEAQQGKIKPEEVEAKFLSYYSKKSGELIKNLVSFSNSEKKLQDALKQLFQGLLLAFPATRSEEVSKILAAQRPEEQVRPR